MKPHFISQHLGSKDVSAKCHSRSSWPHEFRITVGNRFSKSIKMLLRISWLPVLNSLSILRLSSIKLSTMVKNLLLHTSLDKKPIGAKWEMSLTNQLGHTFHSIYSGTFHHKWTESVYSVRRSSLLLKISTTWDFLRFWLCISVWHLKIIE